MKVVIVGGASAAARIRRLDEHAQIIMIERSGYVSYANCGLPYYVGGVIKEQEELTLQTPESFWDRFRIDVRVRQEVTAINPAEKTVTVHALDSGKVYTETYDKLLLAPGAKPTVPAFSGVDSERVFTLRTVEDTLRIRRFVEDQKPKTAVLAGGGFIGLEMAENLTEMGVSVTIVQRPNQLLAPLDADMASFVHVEMRRHGVALRLGETVTGFRQDGDSVLTLLEESEPLHSDMVLLAIGVTPDTHLAKDVGLELGIRGSIAVNERILWYYELYAWLALPFVYLLIALAKGLFVVRRSRITLRQDYLEVCNGKFAEIRNYFKYSNVEVVRKVSTPFTPYFHRVSLFISTNGTSFVVRSLKEEEADEIYEWLLYHCYTRK